jgi:hypothetical protein
MVSLRDEQLVIQIPALEIFVPGRGLLIEHLPLFAETPISLSVRRAFLLVGPPEFTPSCVLDPL